MWWITSIEIIALSKIERPGTKAEWLSDIHLWRTLLSLLARTLATSLYNTLHKAIGLHSFKVCYSVPFGIKATLVDLREGGSWLLLSLEQHSLKIS